MTTNIVIGAGISGLSFGYFSKKPLIIFEKENTVGGLCKSIKDNGFTFDYSGHFIHIKDKKIKYLIEKLIGKKLLTIKRNSVILFDKKISDEIINQAWFPLDWKKDPTINSMLVMIDAINDMFGNVEGLWEKLKGQAITFYFLPINILYSFFI